MQIRPYPEPGRKPQSTDDYFDVAPYKSGKYNHFVDVVSADDPFNDENRARPVTRCLPKNIFRHAINPAGNFVMVVIETDPNKRGEGSLVCQAILDRRKRQGFIWAHECPIQNRAMHPEDEAKLFPGETRCTDHDFNFDPNSDEGRRKRLSPCKHLLRIAELRRETHSEYMKEWLPATSDRELLEKLVDKVALAQAEPEPSRTSRPKK